MRSLIGSLALALSVFVSSCAIVVSEEPYDPPPISRGDLGLYWTFDGFGACGGVEDVRVTLVDPDGFVYDDALYPCDYEGVVYEELDEGFWSVELDGIDRYGRVQYRSGVQTVDIIGNANNDYTIDLGVAR